MNYNIPFILASLRSHTFTVTIVIFIFAFLLLFCWLIETDLGKENFRLGLSLIWVYFSRLLVFEKRRPTTTTKWEKEKKNQKAIKVFCNLSVFLGDFPSFPRFCQQNFFSDAFKNKSVKKNVRTFIASISSVSPFFTRKTWRAFGVWQERGISKVKKNDRPSVYLSKGA